MEVLERHFETAFAAPDAIKKLRQLILTLAMHGKLVPQDHRDRPASELIEELEAEKKRLVGEGQIKASKPQSPLPQNEGRYPLPPGWIWTRLGDVLDVRDGTHDTPKYVEVGYPLVTSKNISSGALNLDDVLYISQEDHRKISERSRVDRGDILFAMIGSIGNPVIVDCDEQFSIKNVALFKYYQPGKPHNKYLHYYLVHAQEEMKAKSSGAVQSFVSLGFLRKFPFPMPPLPEQQRIVAKIDELMTRCDALEKLHVERDAQRLAVHSAAVRQLLNVADTDGHIQARAFLGQHASELYTVKHNVAALRKAILELAMMGKLVPQNPSDRPASELLQQIENEKDGLIAEGKIKGRKRFVPVSQERAPYVLPQAWEWVRVSDILEVGTGSTPPTTNREYYEGSIPWYTSAATNKPIADKPETFISEKALRETNCKVFPAGSLIIALYGQGKTRGQISELPVAGATNQAIAALVFYESSRTTKKYLKNFFLKIYEEIRSLAEGAAQPNLNVGKVKDTLVPLPPLQEQHRIVAKIDQLMSICDALEQQIAAASEIQSALLNAIIAQFGGHQCA